MRCHKCHKSRMIKGAIVSGKFGQYCAACLSGVTRQADPRSAQYSRDRDREAHEVDMLQPWDSRGNPSTEFIRHYPDEAKDTFTQGELEAFG